MQDSRDPRCRLPANILAREEQARVVGKTVAIGKLAGSKDESDDVGIARGLDSSRFKTTSCFGLRAIQLVGSSPLVPVKSY